MLTAAWPPAPPWPCSPTSPSCGAWWLAFQPPIELPRNAIIRPDAAIARSGDTLVVGWLEREGDPTRDDVWWYVHDVSANTGHLEARPSDDQTRHSPGLVTTADGFAYGWKPDDGDYSLLSLAGDAAGDAITVAVDDAPAGYRLVALDDGGVAIAGVTAAQLSVAETEPGSTNVDRYGMDVDDDGAVRNAVAIDGGVRAVYTRSGGDDLEVRVADAYR